jgi:hypothetical protein
MYEVGYAKPPKHSQFQKGRSGNPRGRPKGSKNLLTLINEELDRPIPVREDGRSRKVSARAAIAKRVVHNGLSGNPRAIEQLLKLPGLLAGCDGASSADSNGAVEEPLTAGERATLEDIKRRIIEEHELASGVGSDAEPTAQGGSS